MRSGQGFLLVYSIVEKRSLEELTTFRDQILRVKDKDRVPMCMIGNKCDLESERQVSTADGKNRADEWGIPFFEGSAKTKTNVENSFFELVKEIRKEKEQKVAESGKSSKAANKKSASGEKKKKGCEIL